MFNKQLKVNIKELDKEIGTIVCSMNETDDVESLQVMIETLGKLTELRDKLSSNKVNESYAKEIISGAIAIGGLLIVLKHEESNIITSKAFSMATKLFRG